MSLRGIWAVFRKEFRENLRDKRTLLSALVFGPVISPILVAGLVQFSISHAETQSDENIVVAVTHSENAPNLIDYLSARGVDIVKVDLDEAAARRAVMTQTHKIILEIPADFGARLQEGQPAPVILYSDGSRGFERRGVGRVRALVSNYGIEIAQLRFLARGIDPISVLPISVQEIDVSTPSGRSALVLNMMTYLVLLSMLFGGLYLAIDATAGERERGSLEVLLTSPVPREHLIYGKIARRRRVHAHIAGAHRGDVRRSHELRGTRAARYHCESRPRGCRADGGVLRAAHTLRVCLSHDHLGIRQDLSRGANLPATRDHRAHAAADICRVVRACSPSSRSCSCPS